MTFHLDTELRPAERLYSEDWCAEHIPYGFDDEINRLCGAIDASSKIRVFLGSWDDRCRRAIFEIQELVEEVRTLESSGVLTSRRLNEIEGGLTIFAFRTWLRSDHMELKQINYTKATPVVVSAIEAVIEQVNYVFDLREDFRLSIKRVAEQVELESAQSRQNENQIKPAAALKQLIIEERHTAVADGIIYIMTNSLMPGICKIGFTTRNPDSRAREITQKSGLPEPFRVERYWRTRDPYIVEQRIFSELEDYRVGSTYEYFRGSVEDHEKTVVKHLLS